MKVFVYYDFTRKCWSIRDEATGRVINYTTTYNVLGQPKRAKDLTQVVELRQCEFKVGKAGQARVRKEHRKNVHAGVLGWLVGMGQETEASEGCQNRVSYNPYVNDTFVTHGNGLPICLAERVLMSHGKVYIPWPK